MPKETVTSVRRLGVVLILLVGLCLGQQKPAPPTMAPPPQAKKSSAKPPRSSKHWVDINWNPSISQGVTGYYVYRADGKDSAKFLRITPLPLKETRYRDTKVKAGETYSYAVSALQTVDKKQVESDRTPPMSATVPSP